MNDGIYPGLSWEDYCVIDALNGSSITLTGAGTIASQSSVTAAASFFFFSSAFLSFPSLFFPR